MTSKAVIMEATVPPDIPPLIACELRELPAPKYSPVEEGPRDFRVLLARCAEMSEGTESNPQAGTIIDLVFVAK